MVRWFGSAVLMAVFAFAMTAQAFGGDRDHTGGFFLRLSAGGGAASTRIDDEDEERKLSGPAGDLNIAIGGMVAPNLALHGTLFGWAVSDPDVELNNVEGTFNGDLSMGAAGIGITYYIMPANLYLSSSIGLGSLSFDAGNVSVESDRGVALDLTLGKEWWVGRNWGLGIAAGLGLHSISEKNVDEKWTGANFALRFSATMN